MMAADVREPGDNENVNIRRIFVSPPFRACGRCGAAALGVLSVAPRGLQRECLECGAREAEELPAVQKRVLYLDQNVISNIAMLLDATSDAHARVQADSFWKDFYGALSRAVNLQLVACPDSIHHHIESATSSDPSHGSLRDVFRHFSAGCSFRGHTEIVAHQAAAMLVASLGGGAPEYPDRASVIDGDLTGWNERHRIDVRFRRTKEFVDGLREQRADERDAWKRIADRWKASSQAFDEIRRAEAMAYGPAIFRSWWDYQRKLLSPEALLDPALVFPPEAAYVIVQLLEVLRHRGADDGAQFKSLSAFLASESLAAIPYLRWKSGLYAALARRFQSGQKRIPSGGTFTDVQMIASLLPYSDAMFLDKEMASLLDEEPLRSEVAEHGVTILSLRDRDAALDYLRGLEARVTPEHVARVKSVYGEQCLEPWMGLVDGERNRRESGSR